MTPRSTRVHTQVCITGFNIETDRRDEIPEVILLMGGAHHKDMVKGSCTHLIAKDASGAKYM